LRALVLYGPGHFGIEEDWPTPHARPGWALVRVTHAGICGSDLPRFMATGSYHHPMILGHEFAGIVEIPAPDSLGYRGGERVAVLPIISCGRCFACLQNEPFHCGEYQFLGSRNDGGFAECCLVPEPNLFALPDGVDLRLGALIEPLAVGLHVARRSGLMPGGQALVLGAGPIGLLIGLWLRALGAGKVVMADPRTQSLDIARRMGFEEPVDPGEIASLPGFDVVVEASGAGLAFTKAIEVTRDLGTIALVGRSTQDTVVSQVLMERLMRKELNLRSCWGYRMAGEEDLVRAMLRERGFLLGELITHRISLDQTPAMIRAMAERRVHYGKVMIDLGKGN
jgi:L-iditol 2-dehydrogenase